MAFGKSKIDKICLEAVAQLKETDYTKADWTNVSEIGRWT